MVKPYKNYRNPSPYITYQVVAYYCDYCKDRAWVKIPNEISQRILNYHKNTLVHMVILSHPLTKKEKKDKHFCGNSSCEEEYIELYGEQKNDASSINTSE